jgi:hypothetical protein
MDPKETEDLLESSVDKLVLDREDFFLLGPLSCWRLDRSNKVVFGWIFWGLLHMIFVVSLNYENGEDADLETKRASANFDLL